jgi:hypothetical protein
MSAERAIVSRHSFYHTMAQTDRLSVSSTTCQAEIGRFHSWWLWCKKCIPCVLIAQWFNGTLHCLIPDTPSHGDWLVPARTHGRAFHARINEGSSMTGKLCRFDCTAFSCGVARAPCRYFYKKDRRAWARRQARVRRRARSPRGDVRDARRRARNDNFLMKCCVTAPRFGAPARRSRYCAATLRWNPSARRSWCCDAAVGAPARRSRRCATTPRWIPPARWSRCCALTLRCSSPARR